MTTRPVPAAEREKRILALVEQASVLSKHEISVQRSIGEGRRGFQIVCTSPEGWMKALGGVASAAAAEEFLAGLVAGYELGAPGVAGE
jgi:hypothetical protein